MTANAKNINESFIIPEQYANQRLDQVIAKLIPAYSRTQIKAWIEAGDLTINGKQALPKLKVQGGECINIQTELTAHDDWQAEAIPLSIVYEDDALLIVNKPAGMVVHPAPGNAKHTLVNALLHYHPALEILPRAGILHRLDKDTSGLLMVAKTQSSLKNLSAQLKHRTLVREYQAIVQGKFISGGTINEPIGRHPILRKQMSVIETGKPAITHYRILEKFRAYTLLTVRLETGRTHQIRVHLAYRHHPVLGDQVYGKRLHLTKNMTPELVAAIRQFKRQALHAFALEFQHPENHETIRVTAELPEDIQHLIDLFRLDFKE